MSFQLPKLVINSSVEAEGFNTDTYEGTGTIMSFGLRKETEKSMMYSYLIKVDGMDKLFSKVYNFTEKTTNPKFALADYITITQTNGIKGKHGMTTEELLKELEGLKGTKVHFKQSTRVVNGKVYTDIAFEREA